MYAAISVVCMQLMEAAVVQVVVHVANQHQVNVNLTQYICSFPTQVSVIDSAQHKFTYMTTLRLLAETMKSLRLTAHVAL